MVTDLKRENAKEVASSVRDIERENKLKTAHGRGEAVWSKSSSHLISGSCSTYGVGRSPNEEARVDGDRPGGGGNLNSLSVM